MLLRTARIIALPALLIAAACGGSSVANDATAEAFAGASSGGKHLDDGPITGDVAGSGGATSRGGMASGGAETGGNPSDDDASTTGGRAPTGGDASTGGTPAMAPARTPDDPSPVDTHGQLSVCGTHLCNAAGDEVQLKGMSTHGIQWYGWDRCITNGSLDTLAYDWGAQLLRVSLYVQEGGYEEDPTGFEAQVNTIVAEATERGLYVILDWHMLTPGDPWANVDLAKQYFQRMATTYKDAPNVLYEIANEPNGRNVDWARVKSYAEEVIPVIRAQDDDAVVLVGTPAWASFGISNGDDADDLLASPLTDPNVMYTFHFYAADHGRGYRSELERVASQLPVFVTEWGTQDAKGEGANDFTSSRQFLDIMDRYKISWTNWNYSDDWRSGAVWEPGTCEAGGPWTDGQLKAAGAWVKARIRE